MFEIHTKHFSLTTNLPSIMAISFWIIFSVMVLIGLDIAIMMAEEHLTKRSVSFRAYIAVNLTAIVCLIVGGFVYHRIFVANMVEDLTWYANLVSSFL